MNFGRYEIIKEVGRGAMGVVYQARDPHIDRLVAVKVLRNDRLENESFVRRFMKEAKVIGRLSHPHIVTIYDVGEEHATIYIAMEFLEGISLADIMQKKHLEQKEVAEFGIQMAETLDYAHRKGVVHRDIKPSNIIIQEDGAIKITDFGIAHVDDPSATLQTQTGEILGTPAYMSPEQVLGNPIDGRSDLFSLGVILYELVTGRRPFGGEAKTMAKVFTDIIQITPPEPATVISLIQRDLSGCIMKALEKEPAKRYQCGSDLASALRLCLSEKAPVNVPAPVSAEKKRGLALSLVCLIVLAVIVAGVFYHFNDTGINTAQPSIQPALPPVKTVVITPVPQPATEQITPVQSTGTIQIDPEKTKVKTPLEVKHKPAKKRENIANEMKKDMPSSSQARVEPVLVSFKVDSIPQGASLYIDGKLKGNSPVTLDLPKGAYLIRAVYSGYQSMEKRVFLEKSIDYPIVFNLKATLQSDDWVVKPLVDRAKQ